MKHTRKLPFAAAMVFFTAGIVHAIPVSDGLQLHLDASDAGSFTLSNGSVDEWRSTVNDIEFTPVSGTAAPVRQSDVVNNLSAVLFDGSSLQTFSPDALGMTNDISGITFFGVGWNQGGGAQLYTRISTGDPDASPNVARAMFYRATNDHRIGGRRLDGDGFQAINTPNSDNPSRLEEEWGIDSGYLDYANASAAFFIGGEQLAFTDSFQTPGNTSPTDSNEVRIGSNMADGQMWDGYIAEFIVYDRVLTDAEMFEVGSYLGDKYDLAYIPEPSTYALVFGAAGLLLAGFLRRMRIKRKV